MFKKLIDRIKLHHIKKIIFVDSENVGYQIPSELPKNTMIYIFVSDVFVIRKLENNKYIQYIDISHIRKMCTAKNIMDFCILIKLTEMIPYLSKKKMIICSKDKGFDAGIEFLKERYPKISLERNSSILFHDCCDKNSDFAIVLKKADKTLKRYISQCSNMESLKKLLTKKQQDIFVIEKYVNLIGMVKTHIELDIYAKKYHIYYSGNRVASTFDKEEALKIYQSYVNKLHEKYDKYQTHQQFIKSGELNIRQFIEEAYLKKEPLEKCLIEHFGEIQGQLTYQKYTHDCCY